MKKGIIWSIWVMIWLTPVVVSMCGNSAILMIIALLWSVIMYMFSKAYAPRWMKDVLNQVFVPEVQ